MIGQKRLLNQIDTLVENGFPQFVVIAGEKGSGKKTIAEYIASKVSKVHWTLEDNKIANIRQMIEMSYNNYQSTLCIIPEGDTLSTPAQNAILKIVEEPPRNTYFVMTVQDINYVLPTIKSRAFILTMDTYTKTEIEEYSKEDNDIYGQVCSTPGQCDLLQSYDVDKFVDFVDKVITNLAGVSTSNALKITQNLALKEGDTGYDMELFFKIFINRCTNEEITPSILKIQLLTSKVLQKLRIKGINKLMLFTDWIIEMRKIEWK